MDKVIDRARSELLRCVAISIFSCLVFPHSAHAGTELPVAAKVVIKNMVQSEKIDGFDAGDLNNDGIDDLAIVVSVGANDELIVILKGEMGGAYEFIAKSSSFPMPQHGAPELQIKKRSLYVSSFHSTTSSGDEVNYQFKYLNGGFYLIGEEQHGYSPLFEDDILSPKYDDKVSINYLTGKKIEKQKGNGKTKVINSVLKAYERELLRLEDFGI